jgi:prophage antirepressor-like protein
MTIHALVAPIEALTNSFIFSGHDVRTAIGSNGEAWFCAKDAFDALEIQWKGTGTSLRNYPETWICTLHLRGQRGVGEVIFISEPAVYRLAFRSDKPAAVAFCNWVCEEVLPALRKHGRFGTLDVRQRLQLSKRFEDLVGRLAETKDAFVRACLIPELRDIGNLLGRKIPSLELIGQDYRQLPLFAE